MRRFARNLALSLWAAAAVFSGTAFAQQPAGIVRQIVVEGAERIEPATVRSYLAVQEGDPFDPERIDRSLKNLFATGMFADVSLRREGDRLVVGVIENPIINRVAFEGNRRINDKQLAAEVSLKPRVIYTRTKVQSDVSRIATLYQRSGRFAATVTPKIIQLEQNRVDLIFEIDEGERTEVASIRFVGNQAFSDSRLREEVRTRETAWYRFLTSDDTYDPDRLTLDRELLRRFYLRQGYADFRVTSAVAELTPDRREFFITFAVDEGPRYKFGDVAVESRLRDLSNETVAEQIEIERGDWYDFNRVDRSIDAVANAVGTLGYAFVDVRPRIDRDRDNRVINVTFEVNEGPRVFVERIDIEGNVRTQDAVIRREFQLVEGDAFNASKMRRSRERLSNLNFFKKVDVQQVPGSAPDKTVVKATVEEKSTGSFTIGAGYSTAIGPLSEIAIRERNLLGRGQDLRLALTIAAEQSKAILSFTEPYFLDREIAAGFDVFHTETDLQDIGRFDEAHTGGTLRANYPITDQWRQGWSYTFDRAEISEVRRTASPLIRAQEGTDYVSKAGHFIAYDVRDSRVSPTEGFIIRLDTELAGLGGTTDHIKNELRGSYYYPLREQWILNLRAVGGYVTGIVGSDVRLFDRFFIGGDDLRGFDSGGVGPRDLSTGDALGGNWKYTGTVELTMPSGLPQELGVRARIFTDIGSAGELSPSTSNVADTGALRASVGAGFTWASPVGSIGMDFGVPIMKEGFDKESNFRINFGTRF